MPESGWVALSELTSGLTNTARSRNETMAYFYFSLTSDFRSLDFADCKR